MKNTNSQDRAIKTINKNIAVNAGAGTGKTKVLTERFIYILENGDLEEGKEIESIVAITFTKKATQEMKERIREEIQRKSLEDEKWRRYYKDMEKANISTIHSFCGNILRENSIEAGIDPLFTVLDDVEGDKILQETILEILLKAIEEDQNTYNFIRLFGKDNLNPIMEELKAIYYKIRTVGISFKEVKSKTLATIDNIRVDLGDIEYIKNTFLYLMPISRKNSKIYKLQKDDIWIKFSNGEYSNEELIPILEYLYDNIGTNKNETETIEELQRTIENISIIKEKENRWIYEIALDLLIEIDRKYSIKKEELGVLDYDDLQILTLGLFDNEIIKEEYQNKFRYIMVDEFQDTNELQKKIFYKLCSKESTLDRENLFIVGDPKQSIYGFRGADLEVFYDVMEDMENISGEGPIILEKNFRTVDTVLNMLNDLFEKLMGEKYNKLENHHVSENPIDVEILEKIDLEIPPGISESEYNSYYESRLVASRIKELVEKEGYNYGDFALLFRATTIDYIYEDAFIEYNIPYYNISGRGFYNRQEIKDIINALKALSNRYDTIATIGLLRSPMIGLSDKSIYWLLRYKEENLLNTMKKDIPYIGIEEQEKISTALVLLEELKIKKDLYGMYALVMELIDRTYYEETLLLQEGGKQALANVYKFMDIVREFDREHSASIEDFIDYIEEVKNLEESQAKIETEDADVVKLMTIHKAKGLQFPVVVIPQMARGFNYDKSSILFHKKIGIGIKYEEKSPLFEIIKNDLREKEGEENQRILYVAMTRAEKRLIIGNQGKDSGFKKLIKDLMDLEQTTSIENISQVPGEKKDIKLIDSDKFNIKSSHNGDYPLIVDLPNYNQKTFNNFNISQFLDYNRCKREFYMNYYKRLPISISSPREETEISSSKIDPLYKGNIVHEFTEYYNLSMNPRELLEKLVLSYGLEYDENIEKELMPYINNYLKYHREDYDKIYIEKEFFFKVGEDFVRGKIDRINIKNNQAEIIDFKTNKVDNKNELIKYYKPQLEFYTNAVEKIMGIEVIRAGILFLKTGEMVEIDISEDALNKNYSEIEDFIEFVNGNISIEAYEKAKYCNEYCKYKIICNRD
ncbi:MAG: UvrD-helicase domain-containing protein [Tissierellia bacterium]|nr:UvrD-helicase domain-containing protein [Tissierellia bacterium]